MGRASIGSPSMECLSVDQYATQYMVLPKSWVQSKALLIRGHKEDRSGIIPSQRMHKIQPWTIILFKSQLKEGRKGSVRICHIG